MRPNPEEFAALWKQLEDSKLRVDFAFNFAREVEAEIQLGSIAPADGASACRDALHAAQLALRTCQQLLKAFENLVLPANRSREGERSASDGDGSLRKKAGHG